MMTSNRRTFFRAGLLAGAALGLAACGQNPFPNDGKITQGLLEQPPFTMAAPKSVECVSGAVCEFDVKASVLADLGSPSLQAADLPAGAHFNMRSGHFSWTPMLLDREGERTAVVYVMAASSNDPENFGIARAVTIHVFAASEAK